MTVPYIVLTREYGEEHCRDFPFVDAKGRRIGARAAVVDFVYREATADEQARGTLYNYATPDRLNPISAPKVQYGFRPHALRDRQLYGSSHGTSLFDTEAARDAAMSKYFEAAGKRAGKVKGAVAA